MTRPRWTAYAMSALLFACVAALSPNGPIFDISWHSIDGGGGLSMGGNFDLHGVIGQPDPGEMFGGIYAISGGWLPPAPVAPCPADTNTDGSVNVTDLLALLGAWGSNPGHAADINGDTNVNVTDLLLLLGAWGACP